MLVPNNTPDKIQVEKEEQMVNFSREVEETRARADMTYLEQIVAVCEKYSLDEENVMNLLSPQLLTEVHSEAKKLRLIKTTGMSLDL